MKGLKYFIALSSVSLAVPVRDEMRVSGNPELIKRVEQKNPDFLKMGFKPMIITLNGHFTTICHGLLNRYHRFFEKTPFSFENSLYKLPDGGQIRVDSSISNDSDAPILVILPGLEGTIHDHYMRTAIPQAQKNGFDWTILYYRGVEAQLSTGVPYSVGDHDTFKQPLAEIIKKYKGRQIFILAFSLGGNFTLNVLRDPEFDGKVDAVVCIGSPFNMIGLSQKLNHSAFGFYNQVFLDSFRVTSEKSKSWSALQKEFKLQNKDFDKVFKSATDLFDLDHLYKQNINGFGPHDIQNYRVDSSSIFSVNKIKKTPILVFQSENDPIADFSERDEAMLLCNPNILLAKTKYGGHIATIESFFRPYDNLHDKVAFKFLNSFVK